MKYFGEASGMGFYFTTLLDIEKFNYSATGKNYTEQFSAKYTFRENEKKMTIDDEYVDIAVDLTANSMFNGYSVWGTSPYLSKIRIQTNYKSKSKDDTSNQMLLKRIYGTSTGYESGVEVNDSD